jgi:hypothetical protein
MAERTGADAFPGSPLVFAVFLLGAVTVIVSALLLVRAIRR